MNDARKRMIYQSWHRGCKETDVVLGPFADVFLAQCSDAELAAFTLLLDENDWDIWNWITNPENTPPAHRNMIDQIVAFQHKRTA